MPLSQVSGKQVPLEFVHHVFAAAWPQISKRRDEEGHTHPANLHASCTTAEL